MIGMIGMIGIIGQALRVFYLLPFTFGSADCLLPFTFYLLPYYRSASDSTGNFCLNASRASISISAVAVVSCPCSQAAMVLP